MSALRTLRILCPHGCGKALVITEPGGSLFGGKPPHNDPISRWWRRRTVRIKGLLHDYRYGRDIKESLLYHWMLQCPNGASRDADCAAEWGWSRCNREQGHEGDHEEYDEQDQLVCHWPNEVAT